MNMWLLLLAGVLVVVLVERADTWLNMRALKRRTAAADERCRKLGAELSDAYNELHRLRPEVAELRTKRVHPAACHTLGECVRTHHRAEQAETAAREWELALLNTLDDSSRAVAEAFGQPVDGLSHYQDGAQGAAGE